MSIPLRDRRYGTVVEADVRRFMLVRRADKRDSWGKDDWVGLQIAGNKVGLMDTLYLDVPAWRLSEREDPR